MVGTSAGATIAIDLAVRRPDLVKAVIAHEAAWRASRHLPNTSQLAAVVKIGWLTLRRRYGDAAETLLRAAYTYRDRREGPQRRPTSCGVSNAYVSDVAKTAKALSMTPESRIPSMRRW